MSENDGISKFINAFQKLKVLDGKIIGEDGDLFNSKLAPDNRQAWINHIVEQHLRHEPLDVPPPGYKIVMKDIVKEISIREIEKLFG